MASLPTESFQELGSYFSAPRKGTPDTEEAIPKNNMATHFQKYVTFFQQFITFRLVMKPVGFGSPNKDDAVIDATKCLHVLCKYRREVRVL
jgi:hypothetical protein